MWVIELDKALEACRKPSMFNLTDVPAFLVGLPAAEAERVRYGHWEDAHGDGYFVKCSECGKAFIDDHDPWQYCPNCGAKMEV